MENVAVGKFMKLMRGDDSVLIGKSVHNQRVERFWRDLRYQVLHEYVDFCFELVRTNPAMGGKHGIWLLQYLFLPRIQHELLHFRNTWNNHKMSSVVGNLSPLAQTYTGKRNYYARIGDDDEAVPAAADPIHAEYEGRHTARGESPFQTVEGENAFKSAIKPIPLMMAPVDWFEYLQNTLGELHVYLQNETPNNIQ
jgi:hypothetical protein